ncbi:hypothetical protein IQ254_20385 [Nodosilinea sp. LEGE 07088]|uniref:hypothetical protein n=1 Tax=Nodosilinea sp. LEGE 07088 TaxID=2777968 RepID=UPI001882EBE3|nr:hypothetical protein [Nodosilinea sp. LEGE 07088]MBE9139526.1 hypothetical protein [Nodosilinea sp. LEGE 07088]
MKRFLSSWPARASAIALIGLAGLMAGCTNAAVPTAPAATTPANPTEAAKSLDQFGLEENMPYADARDRLLQQGWEPRTDGDMAGAGLQSPLLALVDALIRRQCGLAYPFRVFQLNTYPVSLRDRPIGPSSRS